MNPSDARGRDAAPGRASAPSAPSAAPRPAMGSITRPVPAPEMDALLEQERKGSARVAVAPTHVPVAPAPAHLVEPSVVIAPGLTPPRDPTLQATEILPSELAGTALPRARVPEAPRSSPAGVPGVPDVAAEPDWATRTHLPVSRETVRTARKTSTILIASAAALLAVVAVVAALLLTRGGQSTSNAPAAEPTGTAAASSGTGKPASTTPVAPSGSSNVPLPASATAANPNSPEAEARAALARLREGIRTCVRDVIGVLPGTSPAVPERIAYLKGGAYKSHVRDYRSPVFSCAKYRETEPQRFQVQWQITVQPGEGRGVAWLDDDGDGKADRALSFRAALVRRNEVDLGEIGFLNPVPPVMKPRP